MPDENLDNLVLYLSTLGVRPQRVWQTGREGDEICIPHHAYLHDGRARSIDEAIRWHGGESQDSNDQYQGLTDAEQQQILDFLNSL